jgi:hypothetical protein
VCSCTGEGTGGSVELNRHTRFGSMYRSLEGASEHRLRTRNHFKASNTQHMDLGLQHEVKTDHASSAADKSRQSAKKKPKPDRGNRYTYWSSYPAELSQHALLRGRYTASNGSFLYFSYCFCFAS